MSIKEQIEQRRESFTKRQLATLDYLAEHIAGQQKISGIYRVIEEDLRELGYQQVKALEYIRFKELYEEKYGLQLSGENNFRHYDDKGTPFSIDEEDVFGTIKKGQRSRSEGKIYFPFQATPLLEEEFLGFLRVGGPLERQELRLLDKYREIIGTELSPRYFRKEKERILVERKEVLVKEQERMIRLMAGAIHDMRGRLTPIIGYAGLLGRVVKDVSVVESSVVESSVVEKIADKIHTLSVKTAKGLEYFQRVFVNNGGKKAPTNLYEVIEEILEERRQLLLNLSGTRLTNEMGPSKNIALVDAEAMEAVFQELVTNATKYSSPDSEITISGEGEEDRIRIFVRNTGAHIPEERLEQIFEEGVGEGTGIGLAYVKRVIEEEHGGKIKAKSKGEEVVFEIELPLS